MVILFFTTRLFRSPELVPLADLNNVTGGDLLSGVLVVTGSRFNRMARHRRSPKRDQGNPFCGVGRSLLVGFQSPLI